MEIIGKGGSKLKPVPLTDADAAVIDKGSVGEVGRDAMRDRFSIGR